MECSFEEQIDLPDGGYRQSTCTSKAEILLINDPCYGLCFSCAYNKLRTANERLKKQLELGYENFKVWYDMNKKKHSLCMGETERQQFFEILQALKG